LGIQTTTTNVLSNIENRLNKIETDLGRAENRDKTMAWIAFGAAGFGLAAGVFAASRIDKVGYTSLIGVLMMVFAFFAAWKKWSPW
jgi:hypothetical protein